MGFMRAMDELGLHQSNRAQLCTDPGLIIRKAPKLH